MAIRRKVILVVVISLSFVVVAIDSFSYSRIRVFSAFMDDAWPHQSGVRYHLSREKEHFNFLSRVMHDNPDYAAIHAGGETLFTETCILSPAKPGCPASKDGELRRHVDKSAVSAVVRHDGFLLFGLGGTCVGSTVFDYGLALVEDKLEPGDQCLAVPDADNKEICLLPLEGQWHVLYWRFDNPDYCGS